MADQQNIVIQMSPIRVNTETAAEIIGWSVPYLRQKGIHRLEAHGCKPDRDIPRKWLWLVEDLERAAKEMNQ